MYFIDCRFFIFLISLSTCFAFRYDCCQPILSANGHGCSYEGTTVDNTTYYCNSVTEICPSCKLSKYENITSPKCYQCCVADLNSCGISIGFVTTSSWTLICIIFAGSCCCCSIVFLSAEHSRLKEGLSFQEAYLIPIPLVAAEIDGGDKDFMFPPDQPTAIARNHSSIDIPVAEPTESSSLVQRYPDRTSMWD
jgi:hypothetical protein